MNRIVRQDKDEVSTYVKTEVDEIRSKVQFRRRNYLTTSFIAPADYHYENQLGVYNLHFNSPKPCPPCPQQCQQQQPMMIPYVIPYPCPQQKEEKECECEQLDQYKEEISFLRSRVAELLNREPEVKIVKETVQDNTRIQELELENQKLRLNLGQEQSKVRQRDEDIAELKNRLFNQEGSNDSRLKELTLKISNYEDQIYQQKQELDRVNEQLRLRIKEAQEWEYKYTDLESQGFVEIEEKVTTLTSEIEVWKTRFKKLNSEYFTCQEQLMMAQAELDSIKNGGVKEVKEVKVEKKVIPSSRIEVTAVRSSGAFQRGSNYGEQSQSSYRDTSKLYP